MVDEYNKKKSEEISKLREYTGKRSPVNTPPNSNHMAKSGPYNNISHQTKWLKNQHYNLNHRARPFYGNSHWIRSDCVYYPPVSNYDDEILENGGSDNVISYSQQTRMGSNTPPAMKTGSQATPVSSVNNKADKYHWVKGVETVKA